ncbi:MAG: hypothetical protein GY851_24070, partial [bacterium]|nr:hypothetical protein [bacterium]
MQRREFLGTAAATMGAALFAAGSAHGASPSNNSKGYGTMKAGFSRVNISPPIGTTMMGFGGRDMDHGCEG